MLSLINAITDDGHNVNSLYVGNSGTLIIKLYLYKTDNNEYSS